MATPLTFSPSKITYSSSENALIDSTGLVDPNVAMPYSDVDISHFDEIVIHDEWGEVSFFALLKELYARFEEANISYSQDAPKDSVKTKVLEVGSSAAYDAYNAKREILNPLLPDNLKNSANHIDLHPSNDRDMRFQVNKNTVVRAEELFLASLQKVCPGFNRAKFKWREKFYDLHDNVTVLSIKDKKDNQYDFYIYETCKRTFFASRDAVQLDVTSYIESKSPAKIITYDYHPLQPYIDRITRTLRIPSPEKINHQGFLLQLYYVMKGYTNPDPNAESILKETLLKYLHNHNLNDLISKFMGNHPIDNGFAFIFSVKSRLGQPITSPIAGFSHAELSISAQLLNPKTRKLNYNGQDYYLNAPSVEDLKEFKWNCDLIKGLNVLDRILDFEEREPLNPLAKAMFDSYIAQASLENRSNALKKRMDRFANSSRRAVVLMQTISSCNFQMPPDLFSIVARYADSMHFGLIIHELSNPEWIKSNPEKAKKVFAWLLETKNKERAYPFLKCLIPFCDREETAQLLRNTWDIHPKVSELIELHVEMEEQGFTFKEVFSLKEREMAPYFSKSREFYLVLGNPKTLEGKIALFRLLSKEDRLKAIAFAISANITQNILHDLLPLFRKTDTNAEKVLVTQIAASCTEAQYDQLIDYLPTFWMNALPSRAEEVFHWLVMHKKQEAIYPFARSLLKECPRVEATSLIYKAFQTCPDVHRLLDLKDIVSLPSIFKSKEAEILPYLKGAGSHQFYAILGEPETQEANIVLYSILCRENINEAASFASKKNIPQEVISQFLTTLEEGSDNDRQHLNSYLNSLAYEERIAYWKNWLQKRSHPIESPLFSWLSRELKEKHNQSLFLSLIRVCLPQAARAIALLDGEWVRENAPVVSRILEILYKDKSDDYMRFLHRLIKEDTKDALPSHLKRIWEAHPDIDAFLDIQNTLSLRGLKLSCVFPGMEKELSKPYGNALHLVKKQFDSHKFTRLAALCHPNHLDALTHIAIGNPSWIKESPAEALDLFNKLVEAKKIHTLPQYLAILFKSGETSSFQECVKKAWPLIRKAKVFLESKEVLSSRGVSLSALFRPLEEDVLKSLDEQNEPAATAKAFFNTLESNQSKRIYLKLLLQEKREPAIAFAIENRLEVDLIELSEELLPIDALEERADWTKEEIDRLWKIAKKRLSTALTQKLLAHSRSGFEDVLKAMVKNPSRIETSEALYPEIIKEKACLVLPFLLIQKQFADCTRKEMPRLLKEANIEEKIALLKWMRSHQVDISDYIDFDLDEYKKEYEKRILDEVKFEELFHIVGSTPFKRLWEEKNHSERLSIAIHSPRIFKQKELGDLLIPLKDKVFSNIPLDVLEALALEPDSLDQFHIVFKSKILFERYFPRYFETFCKNDNDSNEYRNILNYLIEYRSKHILYALQFPESQSALLKERAREFIEAGASALDAMESKLEKAFFNFLKEQKYIPASVFKHFIDTNSFAWFSEAVNFLFQAPSDSHSKELAYLVMKGMVRFEEDFSKQNPNQFDKISTVFSLSVSSLDAFELLRQAASPTLRHLCGLNIIDILEAWKKDPKKIDGKTEEKIGKYISASIQKGDQEACKFLYKEPLKSLLNDFPNLNSAFKMPLSLLLLNRAKSSNNTEEKINACIEVINNLKDHIYKHPESALEIIDAYFSLVSEAIDRDCDINQIKFIAYGFLLILISPDSLQNLQTTTTLGIPEIKAIKKVKNLSIAITYATKLVDLLLSKKYTNKSNLFFALDATQLLILWLLPKAKEHEKDILPLLKKRIYFIPSTPEFHYSEFVLANQNLLKNADTILPHDVKAEYCFASNMKITDNSAKLLPAKVEGFNRYAINFLKFGLTRPAQHVLTQLADLLPAYKQLKELKIKEVFSGIIKRAEIDPKEPTATGVAFLIRVKEVFSDYFKAMHELKEKEREKHLADYLQLSHELIKAFFKVSEQTPEYLGIYSDFLTMIELENFIDGRYDAYFDMCDCVMPQWVGIVDELNGQALDPMTVLVLCQADKIPEKFRKRQSLSMERWFEILCKSNKQAYVRFLIEEFPAVTDICTAEMLKKFK